MRFANVAGRPAVLDESSETARFLDAEPSVDSRAVAGTAVGSGAAFLDVIARWDEVSAGVGELEPVPVGASALGPPVPVPGKIVGAPVNYVDHQKEMRVEHTVAGLGFFLKSPSSVIGPDGAVPLPFAQRRTDQEAELGVVIGRRAVDVAAADALRYVFGYTCLVDVTVRGPEERSTRKSFPGFTPIGPWITTADEVGDPGDLRIRGWVDEELRQDESTAQMVYGVAELIEFISSVVTLEPGDVIATGTPAGVGPVTPGNVIRVEIERVGRLEVPVVAGHREPHPLWLTRQAD